jgi:hypothetical protein
VYSGAKIVRLRGPPNGSVLMTNLFVDVGSGLVIVVLAGILMAEVLASGRLGPRHSLSRPAADAVKAICFSLGVPLFAGLFLVVPHGWGPQDYRNSFGFDCAMVLVVGAIEVLVLIATVRNIVRWRKG